MSEFKALLDRAIRYATQGSLLQYNEARAAVEAEYSEVRRQAQTAAHAAQMQADEVARLTAERDRLREALAHLLDEVTQAGFRSARDYKWRERIAAADAALAAHDKKVCGTCGGTREIHACVRAGVTKVPCPDCTRLAAHGTPEGK